MATDVITILSNTTAITLSIVYVRRIMYEIILMLKKMIK